MKFLAATALLIVSAPAAAEVVSSSPNGFEVRETVSLVVPPQQAWTAFEQVGSWWDPKHTYSGKAENMRLGLSIGACLCEMFEETGGGVEHMRVVFVEPGKHAILTGALGPLLNEAVSGVMDVQVKSIAGGARLTLDYRAAGFASGGADKLAPAVDEMLAGQMKRYRTFASARPRT
jgi:uncharacterized protein YndB with AHSA1/START domain